MLIIHARSSNSRFLSFRYMFAYGVEILGLRGKLLDYTLPRLETSSINSGYSGKRVAIVFFNLRFEKIKKFRMKFLANRMIQKVEGLFRI